MVGFLGFPCGSAGKESACNDGDVGSIPVLGRSPGEGKGYSVFGKPSPVYSFTLQFILYTTILRKCWETIKKVTPAREVAQPRIFIMSSYLQ